MSTTNSLRNDLRNMFWYGGTNVFIWSSIHISFLSAQYFLNDFGESLWATRLETRNLKFNKMFWSLHMHAGGPMHLFGNGLRFTIHAHRLIECLIIDQKLQSNISKKRAVYLFWFIYYSSGFLSWTFWPFIHDIYKQILLIYFKYHNNQQMINKIHTDYDKIHDKRKHVATAGSSGVVSSLITINTLLTIEFTVKKIYHLIYNLFSFNYDDDDLIDLEMDEINTTTPGSPTIGNDGIEMSLLNKKNKYDFVRLCYDSGWLVLLIYNENYPVYEFSNYWRHSLKGRGGHDIMKLQPDFHEGSVAHHSSGTIAGGIIYFIYKLFFCCNNNVDNDECDKEKMIGIIKDEEGEKE